MAEGSQIEMSDRGTSFVMAIMVIFVGIMLFSYVAVKLSPGTPRLLIPDGTALHLDLTTDGSYAAVYAFQETTTDPLGGIDGNVIVQGNGTICLIGEGDGSGVYRACETSTTICGSNASTICLLGFGGLLPQHLLSNPLMSNGDWELRFSAPSNATAFTVVSAVELT